MRIRGVDKATHVEPLLTYIEVAKKTNYAVERCLKVLMEVRQMEGVFEEVQKRRVYGVLEELRDECGRWLADPRPTL